MKEKICFWRGLDFWFPITIYYSIQQQNWPVKLFAEKWVITVIKNQLLSSELLIVYSKKVHGGMWLVADTIWHEQGIRVRVWCLSTQRLHTPVCEAFSNGIQHIPVWFNEVWPNQGQTNDSIIQHIPHCSKIWHKLYSGGGGTQHFFR